MNDPRKSSASTAKPRKSAASSSIPMECRICGEEATGIHYGVGTCEGCKGFFRRCQTSNRPPLECENRGKCRINKLTRTHCPSCRLNKCLAAGMSTSCLRVGRYSKRQREKNDMEARLMKAVEREDLEKKDQKNYKLIQNSLQAHKHTTVSQPCEPPELPDPSRSLKESTEDIIDSDNLKDFIADMDILNEKDNDVFLFNNASIPALATEDPDLSPLSPFDDKSKEKNTDLVKSFILDVLAPAIFGIVQYAKYLQNFLELTQEDQMTLLKGGFFEIWLVREFEKFSNLYNDDSSVVRIGSKSFYKSELLGHKTLGDLFRAVFSFSSKINKLEMVTSEIALLCTTILFSPDRQGINDKEKVGELQDSYVECLAREISRRDWKNKNILPKCLLLITELRSISHLYRSNLKQFMENESDFELPFVIMETLDYDP